MQSLHVEGRTVAIYFLCLAFWISLIILFFRRLTYLAVCALRYRTSILFLTFLFYTAYHLSRKPISIVKVTQTAPFPVFTSDITIFDRLSYFPAWRDTKKQVATCFKSPSAAALSLGLLAVVKLGH